MLLWQYSTQLLLLSDTLLNRIPAREYADNACQEQGQHDDDDQVSKERVFVAAIIQQVGEK